jgi:hypothetical protein
VIDVNPKTKTISQGVTFNATAVAFFANGAQKNYTQRVDWTSTDAAVASVSNVDGQRGKVTGNGPGTITLSARDPISNVSSDDSNQSGSITVLGLLESVELTPTSATDAVGDERFFTAKGHFAGGTEKNVTQDVEYSSSNPAVAIAPNEAGKKSRVVAVGPGTTIITAKDLATGIVSNDATYTVEAAP